MVLQMTAPNKAPKSTRYSGLVTPRRNDTYNNLKSYDEVLSIKYKVIEYSV